MSSKARIIAAIEIGTAKIAVLVGHRTSGRQFEIIGFGECESHGVVKGRVVDYKQASHAVSTAVEEAQRTARARIEAVHLSVTGGHLEGFYNDAGVNVAASDNQVNQVDIDNVMRLAQSKSLPPGRVIIHYLRRPFRLDGRLVGYPEHLVGRRLELGYWVVHGEETPIADLEHVINGCHLKVEDLTLSSLAAGTIITSAEERSHGVLAVDIGAGTTDYVLYRHGVPFLAGVLAVGGQHLSNDLALGLRVTIGQAETLKKRYGRAQVLAKDTRDKVWMGDRPAFGERELPRRTIEQICALRLDETFDVVRKKLGPDFGPETAPAGVVLTGGTAKIPGIVECATRAFGVPARLAEYSPGLAENLRDPAYSAVLGVLSYGFNTAAEEAASTPRAPGVFGKLAQMFRV